MSLKNNLPGPSVGSDAREQTIFPPVAFNADTADSIAGNRTGSGFLACEKSSGINLRRLVMTDLANQFAIAAMNHRCQCLL